MKVIIEKNGINAHSVNNKAVISHGIAKKTELSKKSGGKLENQHIRTVGVKEKSAKSEVSRTQPSAAAKKQEHYAKVTPKKIGSSVAAPNSAAAQGSQLPLSQKQEGLSKVAPQKVGITEKTVKTEVQHNTPSALLQKQQHFSKAATQSVKVNVVPKSSDTLASGITEQKPLAAKVVKINKLPTVSAKVRFRKRIKGKRLKLAHRKSYKVLKNGVVSSDKLNKRKERVIYSKKPQKLKKVKLKRLQSRTFKVDKGQAELLQMAMGGSSKLGGGRLKKLVPMAFSGTKKVYRFVQKPVELLKQEFYSKSDKDETGVSAVKLGVQTYDTLGRGTKTAVETGVKTVKKGSRLTKRVYRKVHKTTSAEMKRTLRKKVFRNKLKTQANYMAKQAVRKGTKAVGKAATNTAKKAAQSAYKAAQATAKAIASAVTKVVALIVETMPWSLIIIGAILLILIFSLMIGSMLGGASSSVAGGGAWLVDDNKNQTPEEIYEGYKVFVEQAKEVMESQAKEALKGTVTGFCSGDTTAPRKIIQYIDKDHNILRYPAYGADSTINPIIDEFGTEDYADYMSLLFVLMTREKQQADGVSDEEIYDFDFEKEDFEEFMKTVNENSCCWGDTFVIKTAVTTSPVACPGQNCKRKTKTGCTCCSFTDEEGNVHHYCGGHPYCPVNHTKMTVQLYTVKDYYDKDYPEIYNFTDAEKTRYEASKTIIQGMIDYWEGDSN